METFSSLLAFRVGNSPVTGEFPACKPVTQSFDIFFDLHMNQQLSNDAVDLRRHRAHYNVIVMGNTHSITILFGDKEYKLYIAIYWRMNMCRKYVYYLTCFICWQLNAGINI